MADKKMSTMAVITPVTGSERMLAQGADGAIVLPSGITDYTLAQLGTVQVVTPTTGDMLVSYRGGAAKQSSLDAVSAYAVSFVWSGAAANATPLGTDTVLTNNAGTVYKTTVDELKTYVLSGIQASVLNTASLGAVSLGVSGTTDLFVICQTGTPTQPKTLSLAALETRLWTDFATYVQGLSVVAAPSDTNKFYVIEGSTPKYVQADVLAQYMSDEIVSIGTIQGAVLGALSGYLGALTAAGPVGNTDLLYCTQGGVAKKLTLLDLANYAVKNAFELPWREVPGSKYTSTPASTSSITMSDHSDFEIGSPVKYNYAGTSYYGIVTAKSGGITVAGAPLVVASPITALYVGTPEMVTQRDFLIPGAYGSAAQDILAAVGKQYARWSKGPAYLVQFAATQAVADTGAEQPKINVKVDGDLVSTEDVGKGLQVSDTPGTWVDGGSIDTTKYRIVKGDPLEVRCTVAGSNGDATDLSVSCVFISE